MWDQAAGTPFELHFGGLPTSQGQAAPSGQAGECGRLPAPLLQQSEEGRQLRRRRRGCDAVCLLGDGPLLPQSGSSLFPSLAGMTGPYVSHGFLRGSRAEGA